MEFTPQSEGLYTVGIHPWRVQDVTAEEWMRLEEIAAHPQVLAIGEAGLDKCIDTPLSFQQEVFARQVLLAEQVRKPLIIHLVKAQDELLALRKALRPCQPWIIHGFRGKSQQAQQLLQHGLYLSFGEHYQEDAFRQTPLDCLFLETDESQLSLIDLYQRAASLRSLSIEQLANAVNINFKQLFK